MILLLNYSCWSFNMHLQRLASSSCLLSLMDLGWYFQKHSKSIPSG